MIIQVINSSALKVFGLKHVLPCNLCGDNRRRMMDPTLGKVSLTHSINNRLFWLVSPFEIVCCLRQIDWCRGRVTQVVLKIASLLLSSLFVSCKHHHWLLLSLFVSCKNHHYYYNHYFCPANTIIIFADNWPPHLSTSSLTFKSKWVFDSREVKDFITIYQIKTFFYSLEVEEARELLGSSLSCQKSTPRDVPGDDVCCFKRRFKNV